MRGANMSSIDTSTGKVKETYQSESIIKDYDDWMVQKNGYADSKIPLAK